MYRARTLVRRGSTAVLGDGPQRVVCGTTSVASAAAIAAFPCALHASAPLRRYTPSAASTRPVTITVPPASEWDFFHAATYVRPAVGPPPAWLAHPQPQAHPQTHMPRAQALDLHVPPLAHLSGTSLSSFTLPSQRTTGGPSALGASASAAFNPLRRRTPVWAERILNRRAKLSANPNARIKDALRHMPPTATEAELADELLKSLLFHVVRHWKYVELTLDEWRHIFHTMRTHALYQYAEPFFAEFRRQVEEMPDTLVPPPSTEAPQRSIGGTSALKQRLVPLPFVLDLLRDLAAAEWSVAPPLPAHAFTSFETFSASRTSRDERASHATGPDRAAEVLHWMRTDDAYGRRADFFDLQHQVEASRVVLQLYVDACTTYEDLMRTRAFVATLPHRANHLLVATMAALEARMAPIVAAANANAATLDLAPSTPIPVEATSTSTAGATLPTEPTLAPAALDATSVTTSVAPAPAVLTPQSADSLKPTNGALAESASASADLVDSFASFEAAASAFLDEPTPVASPAPAADTRVPTVEATARDAATSDSLLSPSLPTSMPTAPTATAASDSALEAAIRRQVEHYLSDANLSRDAFLQELLAAAEDGWILLATLATFPRMRQLTHDPARIQAALRPSTTLELSADGSKVRRLVPFRMLEAAAPTQAANKSPRAVLLQAATARRRPQSTADSATSHASRRGPR